MPVAFDLIWLYKLKNNFHCSVTFTLSNFDDSCISAVAVCILRSDLCKQFVYQINFFCIFLLSSCSSRNFCYRVKYFQHLTSCMKSWRIVFFDCLFNFFVYSNFLTIYYFFNSLAFCIFLSNFSFDCNFFEVIFFFYSWSDKTFCDLTDFFSFLLFWFFRAEEALLPDFSVMLFSDLLFFQVFYTLPFFYPPLFGTYRHAPSVLLRICHLVMLSSGLLARSCVSVSACIHMRNGNSLFVSLAEFKTKFF